MLGDASKRIEQETQLLIKYINDELVPAIRDHSSNALRIASEKLTQAADMMDSAQAEKGLATRIALLICVATALLLLSACGGHKTARSHPHLLHRPPRLFRPRRRKPRPGNHRRSLRTTPNPSMSRPDWPVGTGLPITTIAEPMARSTIRTP